jgi:hypothetical protein
VIFDALDGSRVEVSTDLPLDGLFTSILVAQFASGEFEFTAGSRDLGMKIAANPRLHLGMTMNEEYSWQGGGRLRLGVGGQLVGGDGAWYGDPARLAVWEGEAFSISTHTHGRTSAELIAAFGSFDIEEGERGVCLKRKSTGVTISEVSLVKDVPWLGLVEVMALTRETAKQVPSYRGSYVKGGELWKGPEDEYFLLAGPGTVSVIAPHAGIPKAKLEDGLSNLSCEWIRA